MVQEIETLAELKESGTEVWYSSKDITSLINEDETLSRGIFRQKTEFKLSGDSRVGFLGRLNVYDVGSDTAAMEYQSETPQHVLSECLVNYHLAYLLPRGSPFQLTINRLLRGILEAGLVMKWVRDDLSPKSKAQKSGTDGGIVKPLSLNDMLPGFVLFFAGVIISFSVFLMECVKFNISYVKRKQPAHRLVTF